MNFINVIQIRKNYLQFLELEEGGLLGNHFLSKTTYFRYFCINQRSNMFVIMTDQPLTIAHSKSNIFHLTLDCSLILEIAANL